MTENLPSCVCAAVILHIISGVVQLIENDIDRPGSYMWQQQMRKPVY